MKYKKVVLDFETTGLSSKYDEILQVGGGLRIWKTLFYLRKAYRSYSPATQKGCYTNMAGELKLDKWKDITEENLKDLYYKQKLQLNNFITKMFTVKQ